MAMDASPPPNVLRTERYVHRADRLVARSWHLLSLSGLELAAVVALAMVSGRRLERGGPVHTLLVLVGLICVVQLAAGIALRRELLGSRWTASSEMDEHVQVAQRSEEKQLLAFLAHHDSLTSLPNRQFLLDALKGCVSTQLEAWLILIDLDDFKAINDSSGHGAGDEILRIIAQRIEQASPPEALTARLGGDEFAVVCFGNGRNRPPTDAVTGILDAIQLPATVEGEVLRVEACAGITRVDPDGPAEAALRDADVALYAAKSSGRGRWKVHSEDMAAAAARRRVLALELQHAIERDQFVLHYQPVIRLETGAVVGAEALVRWQHPERGLLAPAEFIDLAESTGLIVPLGRIVLEKALSTLRSWLACGLVEARTFRMAVNVSTKQLEQAGFVEDLALLLNELGLTGSQVTLEITETSILSSDEAVMTRLEGVKDIGVRLAIDDFGTGYAGLEYLTRGVFDIVKLDRSLVGSDPVPAGPVLARAALSIATALDLEVVGEGIETEAQAAALHGMGCPNAQGYLFGRPMPPELFAGHDLVAANR